MATIGITGSELRGQVLQSISYKKSTGKKSGDTRLKSVMRDELSVMRSQGTRVARGAGSDA